MERFNLRAECQVQAYGLGVKEVWEVPEGVHKPGLVQHTLGWPLQHSVMSKTFGGSFLYHMEPNLVLVGFVVGLDYANPNLSPYQEFQRWKHHPAVAQHLEGGTCIQYGARALNEGGYHAIPRLTFPGGVLAGCSAGFLNAVKIKGTHTAMKSGMVAAESIYAALTASGAPAPVAETGELAADEAPAHVAAYQTAMDDSWVMQELREIRNTHAAFHYGTLAGVLYTGASAFFTKGREPWTLSNTTLDSARTDPALKDKVIEYPKPDGKLSFDLLTNLARSGTNHEDQPAHLRVKPGMEHMQQSASTSEFGAPETNFCPARVYEKDENGKIIINAQNCLHCKACSIKCGKNYIQWTTPEGGGGPAYNVM